MTHQRMTRRTALASAVAAPLAIGSAASGATAAPVTEGAAGPRSLRVPAPLRRGDTVAVVAPSGHVTPASQRARVLTGIERMKAWGLNVVEGAHLWDSDPTIGLAGTDEARASDLLAAWRDPAVDAVITARGGYGAQRTLEVMDPKDFRDGTGKWLAGYSDTTILLSRINAETGLQSLHGPGVTGIATADPATLESMRRLLFGEVEAGEALLSGLTPWRDGSVEGRLVGGNVTMLATSVATGDLLSTKGAVVVLEDVGDAGYVLDRNFTKLRRSGWLDDAEGFVLGDFTMASSPSDTQVILRDRILSLGKPTWAGGSFGHITANRSLPMGAHVSVAQGSLRLS
ncbi:MULTISPECIES: S66 peptidase family protein [unclassified Knoellia]|uniref:S66 peptidase family protein n=1 Tax=Knoellia altitudinis TaxID=3404795 RepID=UPI003618DD0E